MAELRFQDIFPGEVAWCVVKTMQDALIVLDRHQVVNLVNPAACVLLGQEEGMLLGRRLSDILKGNRSLPDAIASALCSGSVVDREVVFPGEDGSRPGVSLTVKIIRDGMGEPLFHVCFLHDVMEQMLTEPALEESRAALARQLSFTRTLLETEPVAVFFKDTEGRYLGCNEEFSKVVGVSPEGIRGKTVFDLWPHDLATKYHDQDVALLKNPGRQRYEFTVQAAQGNRIDVIFTKDVFTDEKGMVQGIIGTFFDITDRKRAEKKIKNLNDDLERRVQERTSQLSQVNAALQSEIREHLRTDAEMRDAKRRLEYVVTTSPAVIYTCRYGGDWQVTFVSENLEAVLGYPAREHLETKRFWLGHIHPDDRQRVLAALENLSGSDQYAHEYRFRHRNGKYLWILDRFRVIRDQNGIPIECIGSWLDITERKNAEENLSASRIFLQNILNSIQDPIVVLDHNRDILLGNRTFETVFKVVHSSDYLGRSCHDVLFGDLDACGICLADQSAQSGAVSHKIISLPDGSGSPRWYDVFGYPLFTAEGILMGNVHQLRDITERKKAEEAVTRNQELLRSLTHQLLMSEEQERKRIARELHDEMGQILTGVKLCLQEIQQLSTAEVAVKVEDVQRDIADLMIRMRDLSSRLQPAMLDDLGLLPTLQWHIQRFTRQTGMRVDINQQGMEVKLPHETSLTLFRVVQESLTNAVRHSGANRVTIDIWANERGAGVTILDEGVGFNPFEALNSGMTLGLAGMRERVEMAGGMLTIRSAANEGTEISCMLPINRRLGSDKGGA